MEALWTNQDFGWFLVPKWPWIVAIGFFISKIRVIFLGMTVTFPPQSSYDVWFFSALSCWTYPHFHCYPLESPVLAAGKSWQTGFFHHFSIKSMDTSNSPSIYTKHFHLTTYHWMTNDKYLIRWANHGQSLHIYPHLRRHIYICRIYPHLQSLFINQLVPYHFLLFWTQNFINSHDLPRFQIGKTMVFPSWKSPMWGQRAGWDASCDVCAKRSQGVPWMCGEGLIFHGYFDDIYGHFLAILYDLLWFYIII